LRGEYSWRPNDVAACNIYHTRASGGIRVKFVTAPPESACRPKALQHVDLSRLGAAPYIGIDRYLRPIPAFPFLCLNQNMEFATRFERLERSVMHSAQSCQAISRHPDGKVSARDEELLRALKDGSQAAFAELQNTYAGRLYHRILSITRNREDAEDALQDIFLRAYVALPTFEGKAKFSTWLMRIAINSALMILRKRRVRLETSFEHPLCCDDDFSLFDVPDKGLNPEQLCDQKQRLYAILRGIRQLNPKLRSAIRIAVLQEYSMREVSQSLGVSPASAKTRLYRARKRLRHSAALQNMKHRQVSPTAGQQNTCPRQTLSLKEPVSAL
jgi:RNA polymerase sigma-70 factor, ECF subfamily